MHITFLVTAHLPYLRSAGRAPAGEDQLHELIAWSLIPLLKLLRELYATRLDPKIAVALSPLLVEQLADPVVQKHFVLWMEYWLHDCAADLEQRERAGDAHAAYLARFYLERGRDVLRSFEERFARDLPAALHDLGTAGVVEPLAGAATHAYLPLLGRDESVRAQIEVGMLNITRHLGRPQGLWLPECGWRAGTEQIAAAVDLRYLVADASSLPPGETPRPRWLLPRRLAALFCDEPTSRYIWSDDLGYMGDPIYRSADDEYLANGVHEPTAYDPYHAFRRAQEHATHFCSLLVAQAERRDPEELLLIPLDAHLLGQRWFEGPTWFQAVLTLCATLPSLRLVRPGDYLRHHKPGPPVELRPGSWGPGNDHRTWHGPGAQAYWRTLHRAEEHLVTLIRERPDTHADDERLLNQAARELLLAQSSDWPQILSAAPADALATSPAAGTDEPWRTYLQRCDQLCSIALQPHLKRADRLLLDRLEEQDGPFPYLNYRSFA